jgi:hypothetical protein
MQERTEDAKQKLKRGNNVKKLISFNYELGLAMEARAVAEYRTVSSLVREAVREYLGIKGGIKNETETSECSSED